MPCGADWELSFGTWVDGTRFEFTSLDECQAFREWMSGAWGRGSSSPFGSESTRQEVLADILADQTAGYK